MPGVGFWAQQGISCFAAYLTVLIPKNWAVILKLYAEKHFARIQILLVSVYVYLLHNVNFLLKIVLFYDWLLCDFTLLNTQKYISQEGHKIALG